MRLSLFGFKRSASRYSAISPSRSPLLPSAMPRLMCAVLIIWVQAQRFAFFSDFTVPVALVSERAAEVDVRQVIIRVQAQRFTLFRDRSVPVAFILEGHGRG